MSLQDDDTQLGDELQACPCADCDEIDGEACDCSFVTDTFDSNPGDGGSAEHCEVEVCQTHS